MAMIVRRFDGEDLVITAADLSRMGLRPGQFVAIRPMQPLPLLEPAVAGAAPAQIEAGEVWQAVNGEEAGSEAAQEELWQQWSNNAH